MFFSKKAFTLIELIIVIAMLWILFMATTIYLGDSDEKRKIIEAQWCLNTLEWEISNFLFYALTSKDLKISDSQSESPDYYIIQFTGWNNTFCTSEDACDTIDFTYATWDSNNIKTYKEINSSDTCRHQSKQPIKFYWNWSNITYIIMNKWFSATKEKEKVFYLLSWNAEQLLSWEIVTALCLNKECSNPKEIWKFVIDARSQTIYTRNCKYYQDNEPTKCKKREWENTEVNE